MAMAGGLLHDGLCKTVVGLEAHPPATAAASATCWAALVVVVVAALVGEAAGVGLLLPQAPTARLRPRPRAILHMSFISSEILEVRRPAWTTCGQVTHRRFVRFDPTSRIPAVDEPGDRSPWSDAPYQRLATPCVEKSLVQTVIQDSRGDVETYDFANGEDTTTKERRHPGSNLPRTGIGTEAIGLNTSTTTLDSQR